MLKKIKGFITMKLEQAIMRTPSYNDLMYLSERLDDLLDRVLDLELKQDIDEQSIYEIKEDIARLQEKEEHYDIHPPV